MSDPFQPYRRTQVAELRPYIPGEVLTDRVSISPADREAGSPKAGDMIARNPKNHADQWLVAAKYFADNFEPVEGSAEREAADRIMRDSLGPVLFERVRELCDKAVGGGVLAQLLRLLAHPKGWNVRFLPGRKVWQVYLGNLEECDGSGEGETLVAALESCREGAIRNGEWGDHES